LAVAQPATKPTIVLVHGAFAASSWNGVVGILEQHGYRVVAVANPLRSVKTDATYAQSIARSKRPSCWSGIPTAVWCLRMPPAADERESAGLYCRVAPTWAKPRVALGSRFPGSLLGPALARRYRSGGAHDLYVQQDKFHDASRRICPRAPRSGAVAQRPITDVAFDEPATTAA
jgi:hypothetical protein